MSIKCGFILQHYLDILRLVKKNYQPSFFDVEPDNERKRVYLRHDVDYCLDKSLKTARIENKEGIKATYFIQFDCFYYNIFAPENIKIIKEIKSLGHSVGLHFDNKILGQLQGNSDVKSEISKEFTIMREYFDVDNVFSFHKPLPEYYSNNDNFVEGVNDAYSSRFLATDGSDKSKRNFLAYYADSRCEWKEKGCVCKALNEAKIQNIQLLMHPIWWVDGLGNKNDTLYKFWETKKKRFDNFCECKNYEKLFKDNE
jgi:hypothetical protein